MFTIDSISEKYKDEKDRVQYIKRQINKTYNKLNARGKTSTELEHKMGAMFIVLKQIVKKKGKKWNPRIY